MPRNLPIVLLIIAFGVLGFSAGHTIQAFDTKRPSAANLPAQYAKARRNQIAGTVSYRIDLALESTPETFDGKVTLVAKLLHNKEDLVLDFTNGNIQGITLNGHTLSKKDVQKAYNGYFLTLPKKGLVAGENIIIVQFSHPYSKTGNGFYRMTDSEDGRVYTYTNFEPYYANHMIPSFDQPDIKGRFQLNIQAPAKWVVVSALRETMIKKLNKEQKLWVFPETKPISTYILPLHAGEYHVWESKDKNDPVPLRLFARQSQKKYVDAKEWFTLTRQGFGFFNQYFGYSYPFEKYDQLIVPDFNWGAMENVGAVTFTESYTPRSQPTREQRMQRANTILHEMAHMWFGNLVTMQWWDDLWLNESFATYMANVALVEATEFTDAWDVFFKETKQWAYWEDGLVTRHPITSEVPNTDQAFANFDGITYGKGASTLKQLAFYIGPEKFKAGMQMYFRKYAFQNTKLPDFMNSLSVAAETNLASFSEEWLQTSGTNRIKPIVTCNENKITSFSIEQTSPNDAPKLRSHRTKIALYHSRGTSLTATKVVPISYSGKLTSIQEVLGDPCPEFINLNFDDHDFVKQSLDPVSMRTAEKSLARMHRDLDRMMVWATLWDMVEQTEIDIFKFDELARNHLDNEQNDQIINQVLQKVAGRGRNPSLLNLIPSQPKKAEQKRVNTLKYWEDKFFERFTTAPKNSDSQKIWFNFYVRNLTTLEGQARIYGWLNKKSPMSGLDLDKDRRWEITFRLSELGFPGSKELIKKESLIDRSSKGELKSYTANALRPDIETKKLYFGQIINPESKDRWAIKRALIRGLFPTTQEHLHRRFSDEFFNRLPALVKTEDAHFVEEFIHYIAPTHCSQSSTENLRKFINHHTDLPPHALKSLKIALQMDERCHLIRTHALSFIESEIEHD